MISPYPSGASTSTQRAKPWVFWIGLHVEGLHVGWIAMDHHRPVELIAQPGLVRRSEVVAVFEGCFKMAILVRGVEHLPRRRS
jgi:hypothetical protein